MGVSKKFITQGQLMSLSSNLILSCLLVVLLVGDIEAASKKLSAEEKLVRLGNNWKAISQWEQKPVNLINDETEFSRFLVRSPRNYTLVFLFNSNRECAGCKEVDQEFENLAKRYHEQLQDPDSPLRYQSRLFFARVSVEQCYSTAVKMQLQTAPAFMYIPAIAGIGFPHKSEQILYYHTCEDGLNENSMGMFLRTHVGVVIQGTLSPFPWTTAFSIVGGFIVALPLVIGVTLYPRSKLTWFYFCMVIYFGDMSGFVGNFVHGSKWFSYNMWTGEYTWIQQSLQRQFRLEGFVAGALLVFSSVCLIATQYLVPKVKSPMKQRFLFLMLMLLVIVTANSWMRMYCHKNTMYPYKYYFEWDTVLQWWSATQKDLLNMIK